MSWRRRRRERPQWRGIVPAVNPLHSDQGQEALRNAALALTDEANYGYLVLYVRREGPDMLGIDLAADVRPEWWPAISVTLEEIVTAMRE
jgi:hypothetical protein